MPVVDVLQLDVSGRPQAWITPKEAAVLYASDGIAWMALSAADFLLTMLMRWSRNMPKPTDTWPALHAHAQRMKARPAFRETYRREGLTDWT